MRHLKLEAEQAETKLRSYRALLVDLYHSERVSEPLKVWLNSAAEKIEGVVPAPALLTDGTVIRCIQCRTILKSAYQQGFCSAECTFQASQSW